MFKKLLLVCILLMPFAMKGSAGMSLSKTFNDFRVELLKVKSVKEYNALKKAYNLVAPIHDLLNARANNDPNTTADYFVEECSKCGVDPYLSIYEEIINDGAELAIDGPHIYGLIASGKSPLSYNQVIARIDAMRQRRARKNVDPLSNPSNTAEMNEMDVASLKEEKTSNEPAKQVGNKPEVAEFTSARTILIVGALASVAGLFYSYWT